jgi:hypothetical protein
VQAMSTKLVGRGPLFFFALAHLCTCAAQTAAYPSNATSCEQCHSVGGASLLRTDLGVNKLRFLGGFVLLPVGACDITERNNRRVRRGYFP